MTAPASPRIPRETQGLLQRILWLDGELRVGRCPNAQDLMERWEISRRTAFNTVDYLRYGLGAPVEYDRKRRGYRYTDATFALPTVFLREGELLALVLAEELAARYLGTAVEAPLRAAVSKLRHYLPDDAEVDLDVVREQIRISAGGTMEVSAELLEDARRAIRERRMLRILYYTASRDDLRERDVEPHLLENIVGDWMVAAWDHWRKADRVFMLSRIREWTVLPQRFRRKPELEPEVYTRDRFLTERGSGEPVEVVLRFDAYQARWIRERTWHPSQSLEEQPDGGLVLRLRVSGEGDLLRWVLQYGRHVEVLQPTSLRERVSLELRAATEHYHGESRSMHLEHHVTNLEP